MWKASHREALHLTLLWPPRRFMVRHADGRRPEHRRHPGAQLRRRRGVRLFVDLLHRTHNHLVNPVGRPFGDDWVNYWSAAYLALHGRTAEIYDLNALHVFQQTIVGSPLDGYHYSYPPVMLLLSAPFALILYVRGLFAWPTAGWYAFYRALKLAMPGRGMLLLALATPRGADQCGRRTEWHLDRCAPRRRTRLARAAALSCCRWWRQRPSI